MELMSLRLRYLSIAISVLIISLPLGSYPAESASQPEPPLVSLFSSASSTSIGVPVAFNGIVSGGNVSTVTYIVVRPDGTTYNGSVGTAGLAFSFNLTFDVVGNWTVICAAGDLSNPLALSDPLQISVDSGAPTTFLGVPFVWLGVAILVVSAVSLTYLVYAIRKRSRDEEAKAGGSGPSSPS